MKTMKAPEGTREVNFEGVHYPVDDNGLVTIPDHAILTLYQFGFIEATKATNKPSAKAA